jgi:hypothetical protein
MLIGICYYPVIGHWSDSSRIQFFGVSFLFRIFKFIFLSVLYLKKTFFLSFCALYRRSKYIHLESCIRVETHAEQNSWSNCHAGSVYFLQIRATASLLQLQLQPQCQPNG